MSDKHRNEPLRAATAAFIEALLPRLLPAIREVAHERGYAVAVHGSLARDIDLVAVPWVEHAEDADALARDIRAAVMTILGRCYIRTREDGKIDWSEKPHGRKAVSMLLRSSEVWIDLSVLPRLVTPEIAEEQD